MQEEDLSATVGWNMGLISGAGPVFVGNSLQKNPITLSASRETVTTIFKVLDMTQPKDNLSSCGYRTSNLPICSQAF